MHTSLAILIAGDEYLAGEEWGIALYRAITVLWAKKSQGRALTSKGWMGDYSSSAFPFPSAIKISPSNIAIDPA